MRAFTVSISEGITNLDYEAYVRMLNEWDIDLTDMPRVLEKGTPNRWLHAWEQREDAERFAKELRSRSRNKRWQVREFVVDRLCRGPLGPIQISVGRQSDGCTFGLHPQSKTLIQKKFPDARLVRSVFIGHDRQTTLERDHQEEVWNHVASLLTGISQDQLNDLGGYRVFDPVSGEVFREPETAVGPMLAVS